MTAADCRHGDHPASCEDCRQPTVRDRGEAKEHAERTTAARQRRSTLARMAGNIAAGLTAQLPPPEELEHQWQEELAHDAVVIAEAILAEIERRHP